MNLTYLCSGFINVFFPSVVALVCRLKDDFMDKVLFLIIIIVKNKKEEFIPPFCPKSYHELNLLMFWYIKDALSLISELNKSLKCVFYRLSVLVGSFIVLFDKIDESSIHNPTSPSCWIITCKVPVS